MALMKHKESGAVVDIPSDLTLELLGEKNFTAYKEPGVKSSVATTVSSGSTTTVEPAKKITGGKVGDGSKQGAKSQEKQAEPEKQPEPVIDPVVKQDNETDEGDQSNEDSEESGNDGAAKIVVPEGTVNPQIPAAGATTAEEVQAQLKKRS